jgi:hypothetical protein
MKGKGTDMVVVHESLPSRMTCHRTTAGPLLALSLMGLFAFSVHHHFIWRGREAIKTPVSQAILWAALLLSLAQLGVTWMSLAAR